MSNEEENVLAPSRALPQHALESDLAQIFQAHSKQVFGTAYRTTGSAQDAEDVLQTIFLRLLKHKDEIDLSPSPASYLYRAAINASLDLLRSRGRKPSVPLEELPAPPAGDARDQPERQQQDREIEQQLRQAMLSLSPKSTEIFALRYFEGLDNREIAAAVGMSQTAVAVTLHRARKQIKKELRSFL